MADEEVLEALAVAQSRQELSVPTTTNRKFRDPAHTGQALTSVMRILASLPPIPDAPSNR